ncbi:cytochrome P450 [Schizopora paradoxa]|uniref:Cytochrome P450 n=1 Tax=Schizopora paradoxa TaxID=27342 RepID=A0A0H2RDW1_9AGAM|nr:cytochrome P450 [Schizopora paradoxa]
MSQDSGSTPYLLPFGIGVAVWLLLRNSSRNAHRRLPPGPKPIPILGNVRDFPSPGQLEGPHWAKLKPLYGPISSLKAFGKTIIIINDIEVATDLLDKRSLIYSERPVSIFGGIMCGFGDVLTLQGMTDKWRNARKRMHNYIGTRAAVSKFHHSIELEARRLSLRLLKYPNDFFEQIQAFAGSTILKMTFGYSIAPDGKDPLVVSANYASNVFVNSVINLWAVDVFPFLRYLPSWLPGTGFKKLAKEYNAVATRHLNVPVEYVKSEVSKGTALESFIGHELESVSSDAEELEIKWIGAALYGAGADTIGTALETFVLAMTLYPDVLRKAQKEIDSVIGHDRLPVLADMASLPYVEALVKETLRWNVILPLALPHVTLEDNEYRGYFIPKGSVVLPNIWQMCNDPTHYTEPSVFNPGRFLPTDGSEPAYDPRNLIYGFGRRVCAGQEFANASVSIAIAMMIASFDISKAKDEFGNDVKVDIDYSTASGTSHPKPFKCSITPRSENAASLVRSVLIEHPFDRDDSKKLKF